MFTTRDRAFMRAAMHLWMMAAKTSKIHPSEVAACKAEFMVDGVECPTSVEIEVLIQALETEQTYTTVTLAAEKYKVSKLNLKRQLDRMNYKPVPGSKVYSMQEVIVAVNEIRERNDRGFFR